MRIFIGLAFLAIIGSLASAFFYLMRDKGTTNRTVNALTLRIALSIALFLFVLFAHYMGWIDSTGIDQPTR
ncbi:MAG: twin transmembrane helix small protein [Advenella sp.]|jgi:hypothetical protein|uniref:DUF2909 family protein n=2 Tax=Advenella TaxID=290425 RepID=A0A4Q7VQT7_9BURK|nr:MULTISPECIES: twin transmembrane helix small protein [Advenella]RZT98833.1 DUF2909 family protein [Advenella incenata]HBP30713.1 twin transmembrane helix small protein [Advenella kashmirensis]